MILKIKMLKTGITDKVAELGPIPDLATAQTIAAELKDRCKVVCILRQSDPDFHPGNGDTFYLYQIVK